MDMAILKAAPINGGALTAAEAAYDVELAANGNSALAQSLGKAAMKQAGLCAQELGLDVGIFDQAVAKVVAL